MRDRVESRRSVAVGGRVALVCIAFAFCVMFAAGILGGRLVGGRDACRRAAGARGAGIRTHGARAGAGLDARLSRCDRKRVHRRAVREGPVRDAGGGRGRGIVRDFAARAVGRGQGAPEAAPAAASAPALMQLRRNVEVDRFGIVAHVLSVRDGCTAARCDAFALLNDPSRVSANLAHHASTRPSSAMPWPGPKRRRSRPSPARQRPAVSQAPGPAACRRRQAAQQLLLPVVGVDSGRQHHESGAGDRPSEGNAPRCRAVAQGAVRGRRFQIQYGRRGEANATRAPAPMQLAPGSQ